MPNPDKDRLDELKQYSIPTSEYWWFSGPEIAISKKFFKYWTAFTTLFVFASTVILCLTNWWQTLTISIITKLYLGSYWYLGWGFTLIAIPTFYFWYTRRQKRILRERKLRADMAKRMAWINGEGGD